MASSDKEYVSDFFGKIRALENTNAPKGADSKDVYHVDVFVQRRRDQKSRKKRSKRRRAIKHFSRKMSHAALKRDGLYEFELGDRTYKDFLPMYRLWVQYMSE